MLGVDRYMGLGGGEFHYREYGPASSRPPLIFLHGILAASLTYEIFLRELGRSRRVLALDQRGHGESPRLEVYSWEALVQDVNEFMSNLGDQTCDLVGHSMGGIVALAFAVAHPERVRKLVIIEGLGPPDHPDQAEFWMKVAHAFPPDGFQSRDEAGRAIRDSFPRVRPMALDEWTSRLESGPGGGLHWPNRADDRVFSGLTAARPLGSAEFPEKLKAPSLFIRASLSEIYSEQGFTRGARAFSVASTVMIEDMGHLFFWEDPERVAVLVNDFLEANL